MDFSDDLHSKNLSQLQNKKSGKEDLLESEEINIEEDTQINYSIIENVKNHEVELKSSIDSPITKMLNGIGTRAGNLTDIGRTSMLGGVGAGASNLTNIVRTNMLGGVGTGADNLTGIARTSIFAGLGSKAGNLTDIVGTKMFSRHMLGIDNLTDSAAIKAFKENRHEIGSLIDNVGMKEFKNIKTGTENLMKFTLSDLFQQDETKIDSLLSYTVSSTLKQNETGIGNIISYATKDLFKENEERFATFVGLAAMDIFKQSEKRLGNIVSSTARDMFKYYDVTDGNEIKKIDEFISKELEQNNIETNAMNVSDKKISDMTVREFEELNQKKNQTNFVKDIVKVYFLNEVVELVFVTLINIAILLVGLADEKHDFEIKESVQTIIDESKYQKAIQNIFQTEKIDRPVSQLGYLRKSTQVRYGPKKTAPVVEGAMIDQKTVVTLLKRRGNWIQIQIDRGDTCFVGWTEESKVMGFKVVD